MSSPMSPPVVSVPMSPPSVVPGSSMVSEPAVASRSCSTSVSSDDPPQPAAASAPESRIAARKRSRSIFMSPLAMRRLAPARPCNGKSAVAGRHHIARCVVGKVGSGRKGRCWADFQPLSRTSSCSRPPAGPRVAQIRGLATNGRRPSGGGERAISMRTRGGSRSTRTAAKAAPRARGCARPTSITAMASAASERASPECARRSSAADRSRR